MTNRWPNKDPDDVADFSIDWSRQMTEDGDSVASVVWVVPAGLTKGAEVLVDNVATVWLSGGTAETSYRVTSRITTTGGRTLDRSADLFVTQR